MREDDCKFFERWLAERGRNGRRPAERCCAKAKKRRREK